MTRTALLEADVALPVVNGALFANSLMNHSGITAGCASCTGAAASQSPSPCWSTRWAVSPTWSWAC